MSWSKRLRIPAVQFIDPQTDNILTFTASEEKGYFSYTVNGSNPRPQSCQMMFEGAYVRFPDIAKRAKLPEDDSDAVVAGLLGLADAIGIQPMVQFTDPDENNSLTFGVWSRASLQYTVNGKDLRQPLQRIVFEGRHLLFPAIRGNRRAKLPEEGAKHLSEQLLQFASRMGVETIVQFTDPRTKSSIEVKTAPGGCLEYTINGRDPRPPFRKMLFNGEKVMFLDINRTATLPQDGTGVLVAAQLLQIGRLAGIHTPVQFVDCETGNDLAFWPQPNGKLQYTVNGSTSRPPFSKIEFHGTNVMFPDIRRSARICRRVDTGSEFAQLVRLAIGVGIQPEICFTDPRTHSLLAFRAADETSLQYTVNGKDPRPPFRRMLFHGPYVSFPDINRDATLPKRGESDCVAAQLLVLARDHGIELEIRFTDPDSKNELAFKEAPGGCLQYTVNGTDPRPPLRQMTFAGRCVYFPDIGTHARLPNSTSLVGQLMALGKIVGVRQQVRFTDPCTKNCLLFRARSNGSCQYEVNEKDPRPPFKQLALQGSKVIFPDISRSATLPDDSSDYVAVQLAGLAPGACATTRTRPKGGASARSEGVAGASPASRKSSPEGGGKSSERPAAEGKGILGRLFPCFQSIFLGTFEQVSPPTGSRAALVRA